MTHDPLAPIGPPLRRQYLRGYFFTKRHSLWGAAVCWYEIGPVSRMWCVCWGLPCESLAEAKVLRRFLNSRVARPNRRGGVPFEQVTRLVLGQPLLEHDDG